MSEPAISVRGLRKRYGDREVVQGIDFEIAHGEVFGLLGANGAGKTTTIEILEGYRTRTAGDVSVLGLDPARPTRAWRDRIGLVLQECQLDPLLTVRETLSLYASFFTRPRSVDATIDLVGLGDQRNERVGRLSGGQRRRADVGVSLIGDPDLIFLDEPTTGFDPAARRGAWSMIEGLAELGKTVLLTTHYMDEAQNLADRVAIMRDGTIAALGKPDELGAGNLSQTVVTFRLDGPDRTSAVPIDGAVADPSGRVTLRTKDAQHTLAVLLAWADRGNVTLHDLEARRPGLEEVFLDVIGEHTDG
jgi:ABC-2 type transport system ATP-binding protein